MVSGERYDAAVLECAPGLGEHSDECLAFNESRAHEPVCIEADSARHERTAKGPLCVFARRCPISAN